MHDFRIKFETNFLGAMGHRPSPDPKHTGKRNTPDYKPPSAPTAFRPYVLTPFASPLSHSTILDPPLILQLPLHKQKC